MGLQMAEKLWMWSACEIVDALERKEINQLEVLESVEERYHTINPVLNALPTACFERAKDMISFDIKNTISPRKPLLGLPVPIKDSYPVSGVRTSFGSLAFKDFVPDHSDLVALTLEKSGGVIYAKSNTPEFEAGASTFNEVFGITKNPWNTQKSAAGSSGGAAASVATGMAFIAQGSDFACSIRYPAAFCGIVGLRPTPGLVPQGPNRLPYQNLSVIGPLARNVRDIGLAMDSMVGFNQLDPMTSPNQEYGFRQHASIPEKPEIVGFSFDLSGLATVSREVKEIVAGAVGLLEKVGVGINYSCPDFSYADKAFRPLRAVQFAGMWSHVLKQNRGLLKPEVVWNIEQGLELDSSQIAEAENKRNKIRKNLLEFLDKNEFLILPSAPVVANSAEDRFVTDIDGIKMKDYLEWLILGYSISLGGCPSLSLPCGFSSQGLPVGIQIVSKPYQERKLLQVGAWLENLFKKTIERPIDPISF